MSEEYDKAFNKLVEVLGQNEAMNIAHPIAELFKDELPFITVSRYTKGEPDGFNSTLEGFPLFGFATELEANLANAIFLLYKSSDKEFSRERFQMVFQLVLELLDVESDWRMR